MEDENRFVFDYPDNIDKYISESCVSNYIKNYLTNINARTYVVEENYVDKDYLIDYQKFYCRSFDEYDRYTTRLHFFQNKFSENEFMSFIKDGDKSLNDDYLGFVVVKPIKGKNGKRLIGRTLLKKYPMNDNGKKRVFIENEYTSTLYGLPLKIHTLPFQEQDMGVSACATISLWTCFFPLSDFFGIQKQSPAEITEVSTSFPAPIRKFPSGGLSLDQILNFISNKGLDCEVYSKPQKEMIPVFVKAYIKEINIPIIAILELHNRPVDHNPDHHATVISGYRENQQRDLEELYVHDDQIGPYSRVKPGDNGFQSWENEWKDIHGYHKVSVKHLIVPIYEKIRFTFNDIYAIYKEFKDTYDEKYSEIEWEFFLTYIQSYKNFLINNDIDEKWKILSKPLPKYMWILRGHKNDEKVMDIVYDATAIHQSEILVVKYL